MSNSADRQAVLTREIELFQRFISHVTMALRYVTSLSTDDRLTHSVINVTLT